MSDSEPANLPEFEHSSNPYVILEIPPDATSEMQNLKEYLSYSTDLIPIMDKFSKHIQSSPQSLGEQLSSLSNQDTPNALRDWPLVERALNLAKAGVSLARAVNETEAVVSAMRTIGRGFETIYGPGGNPSFRKSVTTENDEKNIVEIKNLEDVLNYMRSIKKEIAAKFLSDPEDKEARNLATTVRLESEPEMAMYIDVARHIIHDFGNPFNAVKGAAQMANDPESPIIDAEFLQDGLSSLDNEVQRCADEAARKFPREVLSDVKIRSEISLKPDKIQLRDSILHFRKDPNMLTKFGKIVWSTAWFQSLFGNIVQNVDRGYDARDERLMTENPQLNKNDLPERILDFTMREVEIGGKRFLDFVFRDQNGRGYPGQIVVGGFADELTDWGDSKNVKGTGTAMANHAEVIRDQYGGQLLGRVYRNLQTGQIIGAETVVRLPIKEN